MIETESLRASGMDKGSLPRAAREWHLYKRPCWASCLTPRLLVAWECGGLLVVMRCRDETNGQTIEWRRRTEEFYSFFPLPDFCRHSDFNAIRIHIIGTFR